MYVVRLATCFICLWKKTNKWENQLKQEEGALKISYL